MKNQKHHSLLFPQTIFLLAWKRDLGPVQWNLLLLEVVRMDDPAVVFLILDTGSSTFLLSGKTSVLQIVGS